MKKKEILLTLSELDFNRLKLLVSKIRLESGFEPSLQEIIRGFLKAGFEGTEPNEGFESRKGRFHFLYIIESQDLWTDKKKIEKELTIAINDMDFDKFVTEYESLIEKAKKDNLNEKEKSRLEILEKRVKKESQKIEAEKAKIRQWEKEGRYYSRRSRKEERG